MKILRFICILIFSIMIMSSCSTNIPFEPPASSEKLANFTAIQTQIFDTGCAVSGCHVGPNPSAGLNLMAGESYTQLVEVQSVLYPTLRRVDKGSSDESVLLLILDGSVGPRMPLGQIPLSSSITDSIKKWIDAGAPNN